MKNTNTDFITTQASTDLQRLIVSSHCKQTAFFKNFVCVIAIILQQFTY